MQVSLSTVVIGNQHLIIPPSYNKVNGTWACESDAVMNKLLKNELGFRGYVLSDWNGIEAASFIGLVLL